jgi:predicted N-formylglutamate amidohydrolase
MHPVEVLNADGTSVVVIVCEHASNFIPSQYDQLGLDDAALGLHVAWDLGALGVTRRLAGKLDAVAVIGTVSRLVYDLNRPPMADDATPSKSEQIVVPGNKELTDAARRQRVTDIYKPFQDELHAQLAKTENVVLVTVHSFTPVFDGKARAVDIGVLHDVDTRLADAMLAISGKHTTLMVARNAPYGPEHGVTHTLRTHAIPTGRPNVMIEIRNDLIKTSSQQIAIADMIATWVAEAFEAINVEGDVRCTD